MLVITHYQRLLNHIVPDVVHVFSDGRVVESGDKDLALQLEAKGYAGFDGASGVSIHTPVRIGPAEAKLIEQLGVVGRLARGRAAERCIGLPTRKVESYHYTDLKLLLRAVPGTGAARRRRRASRRCGIAGAHRIPMTNGVADHRWARAAGACARQSYRAAALSEARRSAGASQHARSRPRR